MQVNLQRTIQVAACLGGAWTSKRITRPIVEGAGMRGPRVARGMGWPVGRVGRRIMATGDGEWSRHVRCLEIFPGCDGV